MSLRFELYWSFRSPYSYLATPRIVDLVASYYVDCDVRPVYPIAIRDPDFFEQVNPMWPPYLFRDTHRTAEMIGVPFRWPRPDPVVHDVGKGEIPAEQPYIHRLTRLGVAAAERGRGLPFIDAVSHTIWSGTVDDWDQGDHLAKAADRAGLDLAELDAAILADPEGYEAKIVANQAAHAAAGHWGVPTCVFEGEPFFGQDRVEQLVWRLGQHGLAKRVAG